MDFQKSVKYQEARAALPENLKPVYDYFVGTVVLPCNGSKKPVFSEAVYF